jgi:hypothetical protein
MLPARSALDCGTLVATFRLKLARADAGSKLQAMEMREQAPALQSPPSITWLSSAMETQLEAAKHGHILNVSHVVVRLLTTLLKHAFLLHFATDLTK